MKRIAELSGAKLLKSGPLYLEKCVVYFLGPYFTGNSLSLGKFSVKEQLENMRYLKIKW